MARSAATALPAVASVGIIESRPWRSIELGELNPRKRIDIEEIAALAESIWAKGILQNLIARPAPAGQTEAAPGPGAWGWPGQLEVVAGQRRWRAVAHLIAAGRIGDDYPVPVRIVPMTDREALAFAMTENLQRQDMTPLEEADGLAKMIDLGDTVETIVASTGYPRNRVLQRLRLASLVLPVREALDMGHINLGQAQAFTLGDQDRQGDFIARVVAAPHHYGAPEIRRLFTEKFIPMSRAIFARDKYKGTFRKDLFGPEEYAEDRAEFARLQAEAAEARRAELATVWQWAELQRGGHVDLWKFDRDETHLLASSGAIVHLCDDLSVDTHTGLVRRLAPPAASPSPRARGEGRGVGHQTAPRPNGADPHPGPAAEDPKEARPFTKAHLVWARQEKTRRLQLAVARDTTVATALAIIGLMGSQEVRIRKGAAWGESPDDRIENPPLRAKIETVLRRLNGETTPTEAVLFRRLVAMPGDDRGALLAHLVAECVGTWPGWEPELGDSKLAIAIAEAVGIDQSPDGVAAFELTTGYLERLSKTQLSRVATSVGLDGAVANLKRAELIDAIALSSNRDPAWRPPELDFGTPAELTRRLDPRAA